MNFLGYVFGYADTKNAPNGASLLALWRSGRPFIYHITPCHKASKLLSSAMEPMRPLSQRVPSGIIQVQYFGYVFGYAQDC